MSLKNHRNQEAKKAYNQESKLQKSQKYKFQ